jgi:hypothetical protein
VVTRDPPNMDVRLFTRLNRMTIMDSQNLFFNRKDIGSHSRT